MQFTNQTIFIIGMLGLISIILGYLSKRIQAPLLLLFLVIGMLVGEDGPGHIAFDDFNAAYLVGALALATILFASGIDMPLEKFKHSLRPAATLASLGIVGTAGITAAAGHWLLKLPWIDAWIIGAALAPTDAAAVNQILGRANLILPTRLIGSLEVESGLNDPTSVLMMLSLVEIAKAPQSVSVGALIGLLTIQIFGGLLIGLLGGKALVWAIGHIAFNKAILPIFVLSGVLMAFGLAQMVNASGFLTVYLVGVTVGNIDYESRRGLTYFFEAFAWLAQIVLFLMLGLLVTPHNLVSIIEPIILLTLILVFLARPISVAICLLPFKFALKEVLFVGWVGLRGAVPIYLAIVPILSGVSGGHLMFGSVFGAVLASLLVQGWTVVPVGRLLGFSSRAALGAGTSEATIASGDKV